MWLIINEFLLPRKVSLNINGTKGNYRDSCEVGLPQGSALSPILFKIFLIDFTSDLDNRPGITKFKFADDGTIKTTEATTQQCLLTMQDIINSVRKWTIQWRMVINCNPNKTEIVCFNTAENNRSIIPNKLAMGENEIKVVTQTKVLGLTMDEKSTYKPHSNLVLRKLNMKWADISQYCNRHTGFNQRVMTNLIRTLIISCMFYAGHIWMNSGNMTEINKFWYKIIKSTTGAVFNVSRSNAEMIIGLPPLHIQNKINRIKHYLKLCMNKTPGDRLIEYLSLVDLELPTEIKSSVREVFKFLKWKKSKYPVYFNQEDEQIIDHRKTADFFLISSKASSYNRNIINNYTELLWGEAIRNEYHEKGESVIPIPSCKPLVFPHQTPRQTEVNIMSLMYKNNLLDAFLYERNLTNSDTCPSCGNGVHTAYHILFNCSAVSEDKRERAYTYLEESIGHEQADIESPTSILMGSRNHQFIVACKDIVKSIDMRSEIEL